MIPVLDWQRFLSGDAAGFVADLGRACRGPGFFLLTNHAIPTALTDGIFGAAERFFALPEAQKAPLDIRRNPHNRGWVPGGSESLDAASGQVDRKEAFNVGLDLAPDDPRILAGEPFRGVNLWPALDGFDAACLAYYDAAWRQGTALMGAVARDLGLSPAHFDGAFRAPLATLRLLHYPPGGGGIGAGAHTDYGALTLLATDGEPGLQVLPRGGEWTDVPHLEEALVVNIGDCLMRWTNDIYASTPHRVRPPRRQRRSVAFFLDPDPDAEIAALPGTGAPVYPPVTGAAYLRSRLEATYSEDT